MPLYDHSTVASVPVHSAAGVCTKATGASGGGAPIDDALGSTDGEAWLSSGEAGSVCRGGSGMSAPQAAAGGADIPVHSAAGVCTKATGASGGNAPIGDALGSTGGEAWLPSGKAGSVCRVGSGMSAPQAAAGGAGGTTDEVLLGSVGVRFEFCNDLIHMVLALMHS